MPDGATARTLAPDPIGAPVAACPARVGWPRMHAVVIRDTQLHWEERDDPVPGDTELLVAVRAAGLNAADLVQRAGFYPAPPGLAGRHPGHGVRRRGGGRRPPGHALLPRRPGHGRRRRRGAGHAGPRRRDPRAGRARRPALDGGRRLPRGLHHRLRRPLPPGRPADGRARPGLGAAGGVGHGRRAAGRASRRRR